MSTTALASLEAPSNYLIIRRGDSIDQIVAKEEANLRHFYGRLIDITIEQAAAKRTGKYSQEAIARTYKHARNDAVFTEAERRGELKRALGREKATMLVHLADVSEMGVKADLQTREVQAVLQQMLQQRITAKNPATVPLSTRATYNEFGELLDKGSGIVTAVAKEAQSIALQAHPDQNLLRLRRSALARR